MKKPIAFITGATSGIGEATARILAPDFNLIICGRRADRLADLQLELKDRTKVQTLSFDVRDQKLVIDQMESLKNEWKEIDVLVNNAGNAHGMDPIDKGSIQDWDAMIDINVKGLLYVSKAIIPGMVERKRGHIVNIGSIAGKEVYPNGNIYCASKHAVDAINNGMRLDLNKHSIKVTSINPGLVETEFSEVRFKGDAERAENVYAGLQALKADDIAEVIRYTLAAPAHVVLSDINILPVAQASATVLNRT